MNSSASSHASRRRLQGKSMEASVAEPCRANLFQSHYATFSLSGSRQTFNVSLQLYTKSY